MEIPPCIKICYTPPYTAQLNGLGVSVMKSPYFYKLIRPNNNHNHVSTFKHWRIGVYLWLFFIFIPSCGGGGGGSSDPPYYSVSETRIQDYLPPELALGMEPILGTMQGADFNNDGLTDFISASLLFFFDVGYKYRIYLNNGSGKFIESASSIIEGIIPAPVNTGTILLEDFNNDGVTDIFDGTFGADFLPFPGEPDTLLLSNISGKLENSPSNINSTPTLTWTAAAGDIDNDGDIDIFTGSGNNPNYILENNGTGFFTKFTDRLPVFNPSFAPSASALSDLDNDGNLDLILGGSNGENIINGEMEREITPIPTLPYYLLLEFL